MTATSLKKHTCKHLAEMAKKYGVNGWHSMRKDQLVQALVRAARKRSTQRRSGTKKLATGSLRSSSTKMTSGKKSSASKGSTKASSRSRASNSKSMASATLARKRPKPAVARRLRALGNKMDRLKNLSGDESSSKTAKSRDRLIVMVRDSFWLHAYWELTRHAVQRARAALGQQWHSARPVLRLMKLSDGGASGAAETWVRDVEIHGGVNNWYVHVEDPPKSYRLDIGYVGGEGKFFTLARSNAVTTPRAGATDSIDQNWADVAENFDKIYALNGGYDPEGPSAELQELFEERLRRPMGSPMVTQFGPGADGILQKKRRRDLVFDIDAELIVYGVTEPDAHVTLQGNLVDLRPDGTFTVRYSMPNCRQVIPAVASSSDGRVQRTIVLAVERNTKTMEPVLRDSDEMA